MTDELDLPPDDLPPMAPPPPADPSALVPMLRPLGLELIRSIAALEASPIAVATPQERAAMLDLHEILKAIADAARTRMMAIEFAFKRGAEELGARKIPVDGWGDVAYAPDEGEWIVQADALLAELRELRDAGIVTTDDLNRAFEVVTTTKVDNRVLNGLRARGQPVVEAIERNRIRREPRPLAGRLSMPSRKKGVQ